MINSADGAYQQFWTLLAYLTLLFALFYGLSFYSRDKQRILLINFIKNEAADSIIIQCLFFGGKTQVFNFKKYRQSRTRERERERGVAGRSQKKGEGELKL